MKNLVSVVVVACALCLTPAMAAADSVKCTVTEILASNEKDPKKQGIDPKLARHKGKLKKGPFAAWNTFKLLKESKVSAAKNAPKSVGLVPGGKLTLLLKDFVQSQKKVRIRMQFDMDSKAGKRVASMTVVFDDGDGVPIAPGETYQGGTYFLIPTCSR